MDIETAWYEFSPYLYMVMGIVALFSGSGLAQASGALLITSSLTILRLRWVHRRKQDAKVESALSSNDQRP